MNAKADFRLPDASERASIFGRTGSGKSYFLIWLLSRASIDERPWIILDHKNDKLLKSLPRITEISIKDRIPKSPGLYRIHARFTDDEEIDAYLHKLLERGNTGLFTDEGASIPQREPRYVGLKALFAQGRSKRTPVLFATQRPSWINRSVLSESDYFAAFHLQHAKDRKTAEEFIPVDLSKRLDEYHSHWYSVKQDAFFRVGPVDIDEAFDRIDERLRPRQHFL